MKSAPLPDRKNAADGAGASAGTFLLPRRDTLRRSVDRLTRDGFIQGARGHHQCVQDEGKNPSIGGRKAAVDRGGHEWGNQADLMNST